MSSKAPHGGSECIEIRAEQAGLRLDAFLGAHLEVSRAEARRLIAGRTIRVDGSSNPAKGQLLVAGMQIEIDPFVPRRDLRVVPDLGSEPRILAAGEGWLVADKAAGVPVHPLDADEGGTLLNALVARHPEVQGVGEGGLRSGVVHRLDVETSGAVIFATVQEVWERLRNAFSQHRVEKLYRALLVGCPEAEGSAHVGLVVSRHRPARVRVMEWSDRPTAASKRITPGRLTWRVLEALGAASLVEIRLETGFLHQIRATFSHLGTPVLGDRVYAREDHVDPIRVPRQMLHAARVAVDEIDAHSPDPADFTAALGRLRGVVRLPDLVGEGG